MLRMGLKNGGFEPHPRSKRWELLPWRESVGALTKVDSYF